MEYSLESLLIAFSLTLFAGLSTVIGSLIMLRKKEINTKFLSYILGFSAGVMIYVSFTEILSKSKEYLDEIYSEMQAGLLLLAGFFGGILLTALIDRLIPKSKNPHEYNDLDPESYKKNNLLRMGIFTALALALHNFPEGFATFASALQDPQLGISIAIAVAIHNIPEGIAVAVPIYYATNNRKKAFTFSFLSGLAEPFGAIIGFIFLRAFLTDTVFAIMFASVAGMMVYISFDELLPTAEEYGEHHLSIYGLISGMAVMAISLIIV